MTSMHVIATPNACHRDPERMSSRPRTLSSRGATRRGDPVTHERSQRDCFGTACLAMTLRRSLVYDLHGLAMKCCLLIVDFQSPRPAIIVAIKHKVAA